MKVPPGTSPPSRVLFELGRGGMGSVFLTVAGGPAGFTKLKVKKQLRSDLANDPKYVRMFLDEARLAARLDHPNVVQTFEVGFDGARFFLEMEYLEGHSLELLAMRLARAGRKLPRTMALWIVSQVLAGLHYVHELTDVHGRKLSVVHRDVSPHNVFVTYDGTVKVLDFGIAKVAGARNETLTGETKGKAAYMAPEQAFRREVDRRADIFATGVILWQLVSGRRLWGDASDAEIFAQLDRTDAPSLQRVDATVPPALEALCARATARNPEARFATAGEMQDAIEDLLADAGERVGPRSLAALVVEVCGRERAATRARIEACLAGGGAVLEGTAACFTASGHPSDATQPLASRSEPPALTLSAETGPLFAPIAPAPLAPALARRARWLSLVLAAASLLGGGAFASRFAASSHGALAGAAAAATTPSACTHAAECIARAGGAPSVCTTGGKCARLESASCHVIAEPAAIDDDRTLWLGTMFPTSAPGADQNGQVYERGVALAREDFAKVSRGIPQVDGVGAPRPIGLVACDSYDDPDKAAHHLVDDVGVPAIIGFGSSQKLIELASSLFLPKRVLAMSASDGSAYVSTIPHPAGSERLVFRTTMDFWGVNAPAARLVTQLLEPMIRARQAMRAPDTIKVALLREDSLTGLSSSEAIGGALVFNGKSPLANGRDFEEIVVETSAPSYARALEALRRLRPHVVLFCAGDDALRATLLPLEDAWPSDAPYRPIYLQDTTLGGRGLDALVAKHPDARKRTYGMYGPLDTDANRRFTARYNESAEAKLAYTMVPGSAYDAFYVLAYAAFVTGTAHPTGEALAAGIRRLIPPGERLEVGPGKIFPVLDALRRGKNVDLVGTATTLDFDLATGDAQGDVVLDCERPADANGVFNAEEIPVFYNASSQTWRGRVACP